jgi:DNA-binding transcriptional LysR family regulator
MSLNALRTLVAIGEYGSFAAAARALGLSQSAVSTQIRALEAELKAELFDRSKRPPALNEAGQSVIARARDLVAAYADLRNELESGDPVQGRIRLGAVGSTLTGLMPAVLSVIRRRYPNLHVEIVSGFSDDLLRQVGSRSLDAAIISDYNASLRDIRWRPFLRERLVVIAPPDAREDSPKRLAQRYPFIRYSPNAPVGRVIEAAIKQSKLEVRETMRLDWLEAIEAMVHHGHGISIVPERRFEDSGLFAVKRIPLGTLSHYRTLGIVEPTNARKRNLIDVLFNELMVLVRPSALPGDIEQPRPSRKRPAAARPRR